MALEGLCPQPGVSKLSQDLQSSRSGFRVAEPRTMWSGTKAIWGNSAQMTGHGREFLIPWECKTLGPQPNASNMEGARRDPVLSES